MTLDASAYILRYDFSALPLAREAGFRARLFLFAQRSSGAAGGPALLLVVHCDSEADRRAEAREHRVRPNADPLQSGVELYRVRVGERGPHDVHPHFGADRPERLAQI
jgi:hypothetical protein